VYILTEEDIVGHEEFQKTKIDFALLDFDLFIDSRSSFQRHTPQIGFSDSVDGRLQYNLSGNLLELAGYAKNVLGTVQINIQ